MRERGWQGVDLGGEPGRSLHWSKSEPELVRDQACPCSVAPGLQAAAVILCSGTKSQA